MLAKTLDPITRAVGVTGLLDRAFRPGGWGRIVFPVSGALIADVCADVMGVGDIEELVGQAALATMVFLLIHVGMTLREQRRTAAPIRVVFSIMTPTPPQLSTTAGLRDKTTFKNDIVRLTDLVGVTPRIGHRVFEDCDIIGPAVIWMIRAWLEDCTIRDDGQTILLPLENEVRAAGAIIVNDCRFLRCRFHNIGIAGSAEDLQQYRARFTPASRQA
jgi:hypothetical protein